MSSVEHVTTAEFENAVLRSEIPVLVDFYASWCMPCRMLAPLLERLAGELHGRVKILKIDVDAELPLAQTYAINAVPTLKLFDEGRVKETMEGLIPPDALKAKLESAASAPAEAPGV